MNKLLRVRNLATNVKEYVFDAPKIVKNAKPGQFVILIVDENGERVPFTICDMNKEKGELTLLIQTVGYTTKKLSKLKVGDSVYAIVGPLGNATDLSNYKKVCLIGGGIGSAVIYPQAKKRVEEGMPCDIIIGARTKDLIMYENEFKKNSNNLFIVTDDGSYGEKGLVTTKLEELIKNGVQYDCVFAVGPMIMMKFVCELTKKYKIKTIVSMNSTMVDGTGMCGGCRLTVNGEVKYACVDGPEFDGQLVDFENSMNRSKFYKEYEHVCSIRDEKENE